MSVQALLQSLTDQGVELWVEGNRLRFRAPKGALLPEHRQQIAAQRAEVIAHLRVDAMSRSTTAPMSYSQRSLWVMFQGDPESASYNVAFTARVVSRVDRDALRQSMQALVDRHATLRTSFPLVDGVPVQQVNGFQPVEFEEHDAAALDEDALRRRVAADYARPFDLDAGRVFRVSLYSRAVDDHVLLIVVHHIAADGWSILQLIEEFRELYVEATGGPGVTATRPKTSYTDFTCWQQEMLAGPEGRRLAETWQQHLAAPRAQIDLPVDRRRQARRSSRGATYAFEFDAALSQRARELAREEGTTLFVVLLSAFKALLFRYTGTDDVIVGTPTFGRNRPEFARVVGDFVNTIVVRSHLSDTMPFRELIARLRQTLLQALDVQDQPFPLLVEQLKPVREPGRSPLFDTFFLVQRFDQLRELDPVLVASTPQVAIDFGGLKLAHYPLDQQEGQFDLTLQVVDRAGALALQFKYDPELFEAMTIERMARQLTTLLDAAVRDPARAIGGLSILNAEERRQVIEDFNATALAVEPGSVMRRIEAQVARTPQATAVTFEGTTLSYGELNARVNQIAHLLRAAGVGPGALVGLCMPRSLDMVAAVLAIQKAGGAHVPLDPNFPAERLAYMVGDSAAPVVVTAGDVTSGVSFPSHVRVIDLDSEAAALQAQPTTNVVVEWRPEDPAYVLYTSGSTGRPKGVVVPQGAFVSFFAAMERTPGFASSDALAAVTTISFDIAELEIFIPLLVGARIVLVPRETAADGQALAELLTASRATVLQATPATWRMLVEAGWEGGPHIRGITGGEPLSRELADALLPRLRELWNQYGPTETTVYSTQEHVRPGAEAISIGRPVANTQIYILDTRGEPVPIGVAGEIWIGGAGVASGYLGQPALTAERFVPDRFSRVAGARMYRSGDLGRWRADGRIEHLGRLDHQVKIRGFRIELGEVEAVLNTHSAIRQCVVLAREAGAADVRLVAYIVYAAGEDLTASEVRRHLRQTLPDYMIPSVVVAVDAIPLTPSGKVDRAALPNPFKDVQRMSAERFEPPAPGVEQAMADIWREILKVERVGADDNFFELGGHSLLSFRVAAEVKKRMGWRLDPRRLFFQTLRQVAAAAATEPAVVERQS